MIHGKQPPTVPAGKSIYSHSVYSQRRGYWRSDSIEEQKKAPPGFIDPADARNRQPNYNPHSKKVNI